MLTGILQEPNLQGQSKLDFVQNCKSEREHTVGMAFLHARLPKNVQSQAKGLDFFATTNIANFISLFKSIY